VPLKECKIPTLIVFPLLAAGDPVAVEDPGVGDASGLAVGAGVLQAFRNKLDVRVAELYNRNLRRSNRFAIVFFHSSTNNSDA
jgi:hypothetical protein